jgi:hypothetical protein
MSAASKEYLIRVVQKLLDCEGSEEEQSILLNELKSKIADPMISDYIYWHSPSLTAVEVVEKALDYKPF